MEGGEKGLRRWKIMEGKRKYLRGFEGFEEEAGGRYGVTRGGREGRRKGYRLDKSWRDDRERPREKAK